MTPIQQMDAAAQKNPALTALLKDMNRRKREKYVAALKQAASNCGRPDQVQEVNLILGHVEMETLARKTR